MPLRGRQSSVDSPHPPLPRSPFPVPGKAKVKCYLGYHQYPSAVIVIAGGRPVARSGRAMLAPTMQRLIFITVYASFCLRASPTPSQGADVGSYGHGFDRKRGVTLYDRISGKQIMTHIFQSFSGQLQYRTGSARTRAVLLY